MRVGQVSASALVIHFDACQFRDAAIPQLPPLPTRALSPPGYLSSAHALPGLVDSFDD